MINTARGITKGHIHVLFNERNDSAASDPAFKITVNTELAGSAADTFVLPLKGGLDYDCMIDWGDGETDTVTGSAIASKSHTYTTGGIYQISITGTFPKIYFNNVGDKAKLVSWDNVGDTSLSADQSNAFYSCGLTELPSDNLEFWNETLTDGGYMFRNNSLTSLPDGMTLGSLTDGSYMFYSNSLTSLPDGMTLGSLTDGSYMFYGCIINTADYSNLLIRMEAANSNTGVAFHGGNSKYNAAGEVARDALTSRDPAWTITDGGLEV